MPDHIITKDGSSTLYVAKYDEHYHSIHGAIQESLHVFIESALREWIGTNEKGAIRIFEMGFGTGLNALLTYLHTKEIVLEYVSVEAEPVAMADVMKLNYLDELRSITSHLPDELQQIYQQMHAGEWNEWIELGETFRLKKLHQKLEEVEGEDGFDLIYFDAFAPDTQPELWTEEMFRKILGMCNEGAVLTTYSAKGRVRRAMIAAGFEVEKIPGPPGKREMLRARKTT